MIPGIKALEIMMNTMQDIRPDRAYVDNQPFLQAIGDKLKEKDHCFVTRYELDYEAEELGRIPTDSDDIELRFCDVFNITLKAAAQCESLRPIDRPKWPIDVDSDFSKRSELCKNVIRLFYSKADEWLNAQASRREKYDNHLRAVDKRNAKLAGTLALRKEIDDAAKALRFHNGIVLRSPKNQESSDGPINDVAASAPASALPPEDTERTPEGKRLSLILRL